MLHPVFNLDQMYPELKLQPCFRPGEDPPKTYLLHWFCPGGTIRIPQEKYVKQSRHAPFTAGGKYYISLEELCVFQKDGEQSIFRDFYGREVLVVVSPFPQLPRNFYPKEDRCFRWFYIRLRDSVTVVFQADDDDVLLIVEDQRLALDHCLGMLEQLRCPEESTMEHWHKYTGLPGKNEEQL